MEDVIRQFAEEETQMTLKYVKRCSVLHQIKNRPLKPHPEEFPSLLAYSAGEAVGKQMLPWTAGWMCVWLVLLGVLLKGSLAGSIQITNATTLR